MPTIHPACIYRALSNGERDRVAREFAREGLTVTTEALDHCYNAWLAGERSGYRDERNGSFLSAPDGDRPLCFRAVRLNPGNPRHKTYPINEK
ncbi:MAG: hypothetical protein IKN06_00320 [Bacteroidales bacterium]|nr:hypothetical protein [Bacteroidales bacterium]